MFVDAHDWDEELKELQEEVKKEKRVVSDVRKDLRCMEQEVACLK